jgi:hypothetical protein
MKKYTIRFTGIITLEIDGDKMNGSHYYVDQQRAVKAALAQTSVEELMESIRDVEPTSEDEDGFFLPDGE